MHTGHFDCCFSQNYNNNNNSSRGRVVWPLTDQKAGFGSGDQIGPIRSHCFLLCVVTESFFTTPHDPMRKYANEVLGVSRLTAR